MKYFKTRPNYLLYYFYGQLFLAIVLAFGFAQISLDLSLDFIFYFIIPAVAAVFGLMIATMFHNASHYNIKPRWLNNILGEIIGFFVLDGMRPFRIGHIAHHTHPDDPKLDPHPPMGQSFIAFIKSSKNNTIQVLTEVYFKAHGKTPLSIFRLKHQMLIFYIGFFAKIIAWYFIFDVQLFLLFYLPAFFSYFFGFAHLNWGSHRLDENGQAVIVNMDGGLFYGVMNILTSGGYYHKNHHVNPKLYNPKKLL